jgi:hypothetical protein
MEKNSSRPRGDWLTILLHWGMVGALLLSVSTGWRIASQADSNPVWRWADALILQGNVMHWHFVSATGLSALVASYVVFLLRAGLGGRLRLRLAALASPDRATRWGAINKLVYWLVFAMLAGMASTGLLLYFAPGLLPSEPLVLVHRWLSWGFVAYIALHVLAQLMLGGIRQLLKIVTPRLAYGTAAVVALLTGTAMAAVAYVTDSARIQTLTLAKALTLPVLDGEPDDAAWQQAQELSVHTNRGFGLNGGEVDVKVRALHDGTDAYFLFRWQDATRSQKHIPLMKTADGWKLLQTNYFNNDENDYYEDKFAVMIARSPVAGGNTAHLGSQPLADKPGPSNGMGLHYTDDGSLADVWHWKSVRSGPLNQFDDNYFGAPMEAKPGKRYTGGYTQDPKTGGGFDQNFEKIKDSKWVSVKFLPKDLAAQQARLGKFDPDPTVGDSGEFAMNKQDAVPYSAELDAQIPVGTVIPSVVFDVPFAGDRGDVAAFATWKDGWWRLEAKRRLDTASKFDQPLAHGSFMWFAVFDHNQARHTRHVHPLKLSLQ